MGKRKNTNDVKSKRPAKRQRVEDENSRYASFVGTCPEIVDNILKYTDTIDLFPARLVSKQWHAQVAEHCPILPRYRSLPKSNLIASEKTNDGLLALRAETTQAAILERQSGKHDLYYRVFSDNHAILIEKKCAIHPSISQLLKYQTSIDVDIFTYMKSSGEFAAYVVSTATRTPSPIGLISTFRFIVYNMDKPDVVYNDWSGETGIVNGRRYSTVTIGQYLMMFNRKGVQVYDMEKDAPHAYYYTESKHCDLKTVVVSGDRLELSCALYKDVFEEEENSERGSEKDGECDGTVQFTWHLNHDDRTHLLLPPSKAARIAKDWDSFEASFKVGNIHVKRPVVSPCCWSAESAMTNDHLSCLNIHIASNYRLSDLAKAAASMNLTEHLTLILDTLPTLLQTQQEQEKVCLSALLIAIRQRSTNCIAMLLDHPLITPQKRNVCITKRAIEDNNLDALKLLVRNGFIVDNNIGTAALVGNIECLKYLKEELGQPPTAATLLDAAFHVDCVKYLVEDCGINIEEVPGLLTKVAAHGALNTLEYLHQRGEPMSPDVIYHAAKNVQLEVLRYATTNGFPWPTEDDIELYEDEDSD